LRNKLFLIIIQLFSLVKAAINAPRICKLRNRISKTSLFHLFSTAKGGTKTIAHLSSRVLKLRKVRLIESNAKCRHLKKFACNGTLQEVFICLRSPPLLDFCMGWSSNFLGSVSGQIQSVKLCRIWSLKSKHPPPPPFPATHCPHILYFDGGRGGGLTREKVKGQ
jgi:hypothetical protein